MFIEVQKKSGTGYASGLYLQSVDHSLATNVQTDITNLIKDTGTLNLKFGKLEEGTYRILFTIYKDNQVIYTIPYNFLMVSE